MCGYAGGVGVDTSQWSRAPLLNEKLTQRSGSVPPQALLTRVLCLSGRSAGQAPREDTAEASSSTSCHQEVLKAAYLNEIRMALGENSYSCFHDALLVYQKTDRYNAMVMVLANLAAEQPEHIGLLQSKGCFKNNLYLVENKM